MLLNLKLPAFALLAVAGIFSTGCNIQPNHPNQMNVFDGATYDSLTLAHAALASLRVQVSTSYPKYSALFDEAGAAYTATFNAYSLYRTNPDNQAQVSIEIDNLTVSIIALENAFQSDLHVPAQAILKLQRQARRIRASAGSSVSVSDILTELEIAAAIAEAVPQAQPYAALAAIVIEATQQALAAESAASGQLIDLSTIQPISPIH